MSISTSLVAGLSSGFDWRSMIDQIIQIEHRTVDLVEDRKTDYEEQVSEWQSFNTKLLSLKTAVGNLEDPSNFYVYTANMTSDSSSVEASDLLSVSATSSASMGSYDIQITNLARAQKLSSGSFSSFTEALGSSYAGDILINGAVINITETDGLDDLRNKINNANAGSNPTGVTAGIIAYDTNDYRLILTSDETGEEGISLLNAGATDLLNALGFKDAARAAKNHIAGGDKSDAFTNTEVSIKTLLGLSTAQTSEAGDIVINGNSIGAIDLSSDSLSDIKDKFVAAGVNASIVSKTTEGTTAYRVLIEGGSNTYTDKENILETLGIIAGGLSNVMGVSSDVANTSAGETITTDTLIKDIDGYDHQTTDYVHFQGTQTDGVTTIDDTAFTITDTATIGDLLTKIESLYGNVAASLTADGEIMVVDNTTGAGSLAVKMAVKNIGGTDDDSLNFDTDDDLGTAASVRKRELTAGEDAALTIDGATITSSSNTVTDVLPGVTMNLISEDADTTVTLKVEHDIDALMEKMSNFVAAYNGVLAYITDQQSYDKEEKTTGGPLFGDGTLSSVKSDLTSILVERVWGVSSEFSILGLAGINLDNEGQLSIDNNTLRGYLETNFNDVKLLFSANGSTDAGALEYVSYARETEPGEYAVNITQYATQSSSSSDTAVTATLGSDETLTITEGDKTASISLNAAMTISDIVNAVNKEVGMVYTHALAGANAVTEAGSGITSSTNWTDIDGVNLVDGDIIRFSGNTRKGSEVSGYYTINNTTTDTVQGLLSAIGTAYGSDVNISTDSSGHILITDKYAGDSRLSLSFDYSETTNGVDIFGTVLTTNTGGQEGRYALDITASNDGSNHLKLAHENYGSGFAFTIQEDSDTGLWNNSQTTPATVDNGIDVAGSINGEIASGSGQLLTGADGEANIDGLVVKYTGSATGDVGKVRFTLGVAAAFNRVLYNITDPYEGYVPFKQDSLQNSIKDLETRIDRMEERLNNKMEMMVNRFVAMELALSKIQSQSQWLAGQINAITDNWA